MKKIMSTAFLFLALAPISKVTQASLSPTGVIKTKTANIFFIKPSKLEMTITPLSNLIAEMNSDKTKVATFSISVAQPAYLGVRWTPKEGDINADTIQLSGNSDTRNKISLKFKTEINSAPTSDGWRVVSQLMQELNGVVFVNNDQFIPADYYTLSLDASVFTL